MVSFLTFLCPVSSWTPWLRLFHVPDRHMKIECSLWGTSMLPCICIDVCTCLCRCFWSTITWSSSIWCCGKWSLEWCWCRPTPRAGWELGGTAERERNETTGQLSFSQVLITQIHYRRTLMISDVLDMQGSVVRTHLLHFQGQIIALCFFPK